MQWKTKVFGKHAKLHEEKITVSNILLVDDEQEVTSLLKKRLEKRGFSCCEAANGQEALDALKNDTFHIVIMDVKMPVMDGISALQVIHETYPDIKVILLSGHADMQLAVHAMQCGAFGYLMKPVELEELLYKIEDAQTQARLENNA